MRDRIGRWTKAVALSALVLGLPAWSWGQSFRQLGIYPVFDGWETLPDGSKVFYFGYMNRHEEPMTIAVGPDNGFEPGPVDRMQPTNFLPGRQEHVFTIKMPKDFTGKIVWTLKSGVGVQKANASADQLYILEVEEEEPGGHIDPPAITAPAELTAQRGAELRVAPTVKAVAPKREANIEGSGPRQAGLQVLWSKYRGPGAVTFARDPNVKPVATATNARRPEPPPTPGLFTVPCALPADSSCGVALAKFSEPGDYILRAVARQQREQRDVLVRVKVQ
jgi:hypothetical protein